MISHSELVGIVAGVVLMFGAAYLLNRYLCRVYLDRNTWLDPVLKTLESLVLRVSGLSHAEDLTWKQNLLAFLSITMCWFVLSMAVLMNMSWLPLNPDGQPSMSADLAFNTSISFVSNTNLQHYSGETGVSLLGQLMLMFLQFVSAGSGMAIAVLAMMTMRSTPSAFVSNFFHVFVRTCVRVLLPLSVVLATVLVFSGSPMDWQGHAHIRTLRGADMQLSRGPVAAFVAIKQLGTNGGGFFGTNSAHPFENPTRLTNVLETMSIALIPIAMVFMFGGLIQKPRLAWMMIGVMSICFVLLVAPTLYAESAGNPALNKLGVLQPAGNMEGKEVRIGAEWSALWATLTTCTSNGSVNAMHDSLMPLSGLSVLLGMMVNCVFGGVGVGFLNFYIFLILAVFISGLMVGRTPEFLGKKIEAREMKIAMIVALLHPLLILSGTALSSWLYSTNPASYSAWLNNSGYHGFSEMMYEFTSASANNGSGFEGLGDNTPFWNIACGLVMFVARYLPIIGPLAIAGLLMAKKTIPEGPGTLQTDSVVFATVVCAVIVIVAALAFFPALTLGPIAEHLSLL